MNIMHDYKRSYTNIFWFVYHTLHINYLRVYKNSAKNDIFKKNNLLN